MTSPSSTSELTLLHVQTPMSRCLFTITYARATPHFNQFNPSETFRSAHWSKTPRSAPSLQTRLTAYLFQHQTPQQNTSRNPTNMAFLLPGLRRSLLLATPLILSTPLLIQHHKFSQPTYCDSADPLAKLTRNYASEARTPIITESGAANPRAIRQVSMGSILGVFCGLGISVFSKPLAVLIGLGIFVLQVSLEDE
jgi:hypothetical protein